MTARTARHPAAPAGGDTDEGQKGMTKGAQS
jgi:hypothetical protein